MVLKMDEIEEEKFHDGRLSARHAVDGLAKDVATIQSN